MQSDLFDLHARLEDEHWWFVGRRRIVVSLVHALAPLGRGAVVLDVGCGTGATVGALASDYRCFGVDGSADAVRLAAGRFPQADFICGTAPADLPDISGEADVILLMDVLEHVEDDTALLRALALAMKPGAHLLITVPADPRLWSPHDVRFAHYRRYVPTTLAALWRDLPVSPLLLSYFNSRLFPLAWMARTIAQRRNRSLGEAGTDLRMPTPALNAVLTRLFAGERRALQRALQRHTSAYSRGVSLVAALRRREETVSAA